MKNEKELKEIDKLNKNLDELGNKLGVDKK